MSENPERNQQDQRNADRARRQPADHAHYVQVNPSQAAAISFYSEMFKLWLALFEILVNSVLFTSSEQDEPDENDAPAAERVKTFEQLCNYVRTVKVNALPAAHCDRFIKIFATHINSLDAEQRKYATMALCRALMFSSVSNCIYFVYSISRTINLDVFRLMCGAMPTLAGLIMKTGRELVTYGKWSVCFTPYDSVGEIPEQLHDVDYETSLSIGALTMLTNRKFRALFAGLQSVQKTNVAIELVLAMHTPEITSRAVYLLTQLHGLTQVTWPSPFMLAISSLCFKTVTAAQIDQLFNVFSNDLRLDLITVLFANCEHIVKNLARIYVYMLVHCINYPESTQIPPKSSINGELPPKSSINGELPPKLGFLDLLPPAISGGDTKKIDAEWLLGETENEEFRSLFIRVILLIFPDIAKFYVPPRRITEFDKSSVEWWQVSKFFDLQVLSEDPNSSAVAVSDIDSKQMSYPFIRDISEPATGYLMALSTSQHLIDCLGVETPKLGLIIGQIMTIMWEVMAELMTSDEFDRITEERARAEQRRMLEAHSLGQRHPTTSAAEPATSAAEPSQEKIKSETTEKMFKMMKHPAHFLSDLKRLLKRCIEQVDQVNVLHALTDLYERCYRAELSNEHFISSAQASLLDATEFV